MSTKGLPSVVGLAVLLLLALSACGGGHGNGPTEPPGTGQLMIQDSGCACSKGPYPPIPIYVDGALAGQLAVFGHITFNLSAGNHTWAYSDPSLQSNVTIRPGTTVTKYLQTNIDCDADQCSDPDPGDS